MNTEILNILSAYGVEAIVIALLINLVTNLIKKPIKMYSDKSGKNINKYISFIPIVLGFAGSILYYGFTAGWSELVFENVFTLGVSSASLSLAVFAVFEKFIPKTKQSINTEIAASIIETAVEVYDTHTSGAEEKASEEIEILSKKSNAGNNESVPIEDFRQNNEQKARIILDGKSNETETEKTQL